jgi:sensor domain CHASE-containing protein
MSLHKRSFWITLAIIASLHIFICGVLYLVIMQGFLKLEQQYAEKNVMRARDVILDRINNLTIKSSDWAYWDDTYAFVDDGNKDFIQSNITFSAVTNLKLDFMIFANTARQVVFSRTG